MGFSKIVNPCCCELRVGCMIIASIDIILYTFSFFMHIISLFVDAPVFKNLHASGEPTFAATFVFVFIFLVLAIALLIGTLKKNVVLCQMWLFLIPLGLVILIVAGILMIVSGGDNSSENPNQNQKPPQGFYIAAGIISLVFPLLIKLYEMFCVYCYIKMLKNPPQPVQPMGEMMPLASGQYQYQQSYGQLATYPTTYPQAYPQAYPTTYPQAYPPNYPPAYSPNYPPANSTPPPVMKAPE